MASKKHIKREFKLIFAILLITGLSLTGYKIYNQKLIDEENKKKELLIETIQEHYNNYVKIVTDSPLYHFDKENNNYVTVATLYKDEVIELEKITINDETKYFYIPSLDMYIDYENVTPVDELINYDTRYKKYIPYNLNVVTNDEFSMYDNEKPVYTFYKSQSFPIIINNYENKYYVEYKDRLLSISKDDIKEIIINTNSNIANASSVTTFCYHKVYDTDEKCTDTYTCKKKSNFSQEMKYLKDNDYLTMTMQEMYLYLSNKIQVPKNSVVITLDDGYKIKSAIEVLEEYQINATCFPIGADFKDLSIFKSDYLELHSHTHSMHKTGVCKKENSSQQGGGILCLSESYILDDLKKTREALNNPIALAYPFYDHNTRAMKLVEKSGFKIAFVGRAGVMGRAKPGINLYKVPRMTIWDNMSFNTWKSYL